MLAGVAVGLISLVEKFVTNKGEKERLIALIRQGEQQNNFELAMKELDIVMEQNRVNEAQAQHPSIFVAGPRPFAMWICASTLLFGAIIKILIPAGIIVQAYAHDVVTLQEALNQLNAIDLEYFLTMLGGMLGLSVMRSFDKLKGTSKTG